MLVNCGFKASGEQAEIMLAVLTTATKEAIFLIAIRRDELEIEDAAQAGKNCIEI